MIHPTDASLVAHWFVLGWCLVSIPYLMWLAGSAWLQNRDPEE